MKKNPALQEEWQKIGDLWQAGRLLGIELNGKVYNFTPKQKQFIDAKNKYCLYYGGFGCVDVKTKLYDAESKEEIAIETLYKEKRAIKVLSYDKGRVVKAQSSVPVEYDKDKLFKVKTNKREIVVTAKHRFLTQSGWKKLSSCVVGEQLLGYSHDLPQSSIDKETIQGINYEKTDNYYDIHVFGTNNYLAEGLFHHNSGKTLAMLIKLILSALCIPGNNILLGRQYLSDITRALLPDIFDLLPSNLYNYKVKDGMIEFFNGSIIILMGLDAMQTGGEDSLKKAEQKLKSLNLGAFFIDQLEEIDKNVFIQLTTRIRRKGTLKQGVMTTNPANFWAYDYFIKNPHKDRDIFRIQGSTLDNPTLDQDYIQDLLNHDEMWVERYVKGTWSPDILVDRVVFGQEYVAKLKAMTREPLMIRQGCEIYEKFDARKSYQMGVDPSEGSIDPSSISVVSSDGRKVAKYRGFITIPGLINKVQFLYEEYNKPFIIPEGNSCGAALIEGIKDLRIYRREHFNYREKKKTMKLGFWTNHESKKALISHFQDLLRKGYPKIYDIGTVEEFMTFIWTDVARHKGAAAQRNYHDDDVMSTLLAYWGLSPSIIAAREARKKVVPTRKTFQYF